MSIASRNDKVTNKTESVMGPAQSSSEISLKRSTSDPEKVPSSETPDEVHSLPKRLIKSGGFVWKKFKAGPERFFQPNDSSFNPPPGKSPRTSPEPILDISPAEETGPGHAVLEHIDAPTILLAPPQRPDLPSLSNDQALPHYPLEPRSESSKQGNTRTRPWRTTKTDFPATDLPDSQFFFTLGAFYLINMMISVTFLSFTLKTMAQDMVLLMALLSAVLIPWIRIFVRPVPSKFRQRVEAKVIFPWLLRTVYSTLAISPAVRNLVLAYHQGAMILVTSYAIILPVLIISVTISTHSAFLLMSESLVAYRRFLIRNDNNSVWDLRELSSSASSQDSSDDAGLDSRHM